ncbi:MAG: Vitamin B12 import ATP-binding protein BtuD [Pyrinomonadaceae bacterium]|nr:Vitamin B12 import ATP-binding protein BtuD [Pyrinomonadaceae bacterium]
MWLASSRLVIWCEDAAPSWAMNAIEIRSLTKSYGNRNVVDHVSFNVRSGTVFGFLGPNGAGKTTTIRMLLSLIRPDAGEISILGLDARKQFASVASRIAAVVETPTYFPNLSALQTLRTLADYAGISMSREQLLSALDRHGLLFASEQKVDGFSLGMKQRLAVVAALIGDPEVVFLDEPTNGLDPEGISNMRGLIRRLADDEGRTVFVTSHLLAEVEHTCDEVLFLNDGRVCVQGTLAELLTNNKVCVRGFPIESVYRVVARYFPNRHFRKVDDPPGIELAIGYDEIPLLVRYLAGENIDIHEVFVKSRTLEEVFYAVIGTQDI